MIRKEKISRNFCHFLINCTCFIWFWLDGWLADCLSGILKINHTWFCCFSLYFDRLNWGGTFLLQVCDVRGPGHLDEAIQDGRRTNVLSGPYVSKETPDIQSVAVGCLWKRKPPLPVLCVHWITLWIEVILPRRRKQWISFLGVLYFIPTASTTYCASLCLIAYQWV